MNVEQRIAIEKQIIRKLLEDLISADYCVNVWDGWAYSVKRSVNVNEILEGMFSTDEDVLGLRKVGQNKMTGQVLLVYGNDGHDVIADYSVSLESVLEGANQLADEIASQS